MAFYLKIRNFFIKFPETMLRLHMPISSVTFFIS